MAKTSKVRQPRRGEVYAVNSDPTIGAEIKKTRPALVLQNDVANRWSPITIVAAVTSRSEEKIYPTEVPVQPPEGGLGRASVVLLNEIRSVDNKRLVRRLGALEEDTMRQVDRALMISLGVVEVE